MAESIAKTFFPKLYNKLEKKKHDARNVPLTMADINTLLSLQINNKPVFPSIDLFYSEEYLQALKSGTSGVDLDKIERFRKPSEKELNLLFCDIHTRDEKWQFSSGNNQPS